MQEKILFLQKSIGPLHGILLQTDAHLTRYDICWQHLYKFNSTGIPNGILASFI